MSFKMTLSENGPHHHNHNHNSDPVEEGPWRNLTNDILLLILKRLNTTLDVTRFRSICKSFRSFASPPGPHIIFPLSLPPLHPNSRPFSLSPSLFYLLSPSTTSPTNQRWLIHVTETGERKWDLLNPLTKHKLYVTSRGKFDISFLGFRNYEVGRSYRLTLVGNSSEEDGTFDFGLFTSSISVRKVVVKFEESSVFVLGLFDYREIGVWKSGDSKWSFVEIGESKEDEIIDVISFDERFFAVDRRGRLWVINANVTTSTFELVKVVDSTEEGNYNSMCNNFYLLESNFRLYLVNKIVRVRNYYDEKEEDWVVDKNSARPIGVEVFVLDEKEKRWEKVKSVGNKVFFVSRDAAFSVSVEELGWSEGDCVYFEGLTGYDDEADMVFGLNAGVYTLEDGVFRPFDSDPARWTEIFWPPSSWFVKDDGYPDCEMQG